MELFEHCEDMLEQKPIEERTFKEIYVYRLHNIASNETVRQEKLMKHVENRRRFLSLLAQMGIDVRQ